MFEATLGQIDPRLVPTDIPSLSKVVNALIFAGKFEPPADRARNRQSLGSTGTTPDRGGVQRSRTTGADLSESSGSGSGEASSESEASTPVPGERLMPPPSAPFTPTRAPRRFKETTAKELGGSDAITNYLANATGAGRASKQARRTWTPHSTSPLRLASLRWWSRSRPPASRRRPLLAIQCQHTGTRVRCGACFYARGGARVFDYALNCYLYLSIAGSSAHDPRARARDEHAGKRRLGRRPQSYRARHEKP